MTHTNLIQQLERDIRNQVLVDNLKRLNRKQKLMVHLHRNAFPYAFVFCALFWIAACMTVVHATECPDPGVRCKVLFLTRQEEQMLMTQNGILDTAAQGRSLDLGQFSVYLKTRIGSAPQGEVKPVPAPEQPKPKNKSAAPVDNK